MNTQNSFPEVDLSYSFLIKNRHPSRMCDLAIDDVKKSGLSPEILKKANIHLFDGNRQDLVNKLGFAKIDGNELLQGNELLEFPYPSHDYGFEKPIFSVFKPIPGLDNEKKYLRPIGKPALPYILPEVFNVSKKTNVPVWITEGEKKTLKLIQHNQKAIGLGGVFGFRAGKDSDFTADKSLWTEIQGFNWNGRNAYIAFDNDWRTNKQVRFALLELCVKLFCKGAIVYIVEWNIGKGIDDYLTSVDDPGKALENLKLQDTFVSKLKPEYLAEIIRAFAMTKEIDVAESQYKALIETMAKSFKVKSKDLLKDIEKKRSEYHQSQANNIERAFYYERSVGSKKVLAIDPLELLNFLADSGFARSYFDGAHGSTLLRVQKNVVDDASSEEAYDLAFGQISKLPEQLTENFTRKQLAEAFAAPNFKFISDSQLKKLVPHEFIFHRDTRQNSYFYFENGVVEVKSTGRSFFEYGNIENKYVWKKWIRNRKFIEADDITGDFYRFICLICNNDNKRITALKTAIGYLLHRYKDSGNAKAVILVDEKISDTCEGRSGKSLVALSISKFRNLLNIDGKRFKADENFALENITRATELVCFDDVKRDFDFEALFHAITGDVEVVGKYEKKFCIPFEDAPKFCVTTNYMIMAEGGSADGRKAEYEIAPYFSKDHTPKDEFGRLFFDEWDEAEWARFDNFMLDCVQLYLEKSLITADPINLVQRKIVQRTHIEFYEWAESFFKISGQINDDKMHWYSRDELMESFLEYSEDFEKSHERISRDRFSNNKFTTWLKYYCTHSGMIIEEHKGWDAGKAIRGFKVVKQ
ncbi:MAG: DUF3854 domain-containing protein [Candidatus Riflebacteria bacterium]|nr:DUF3854 domain-containing protein [Candidatus Riflebacteria bacterium]